MFYLAMKAVISGVIVAAVSEIAKRYPGWGGLIASPPLVSILGTIRLWRDTRDAARMADHASGTFCASVASDVSARARSAAKGRGLLAAGCALTVALYVTVILIGPRLGLKL